MNWLTERWAKKLGGRLEPELAKPYLVAPISHAAQYPNVPKPDFGLTPSLVAQQWFGRDLLGEDMPKVAADLLEQGYDSPALRQLAGVMGRPSSADVNRLVEQVLLESGVELPRDERLARLMMTRQIAREVIAGLRNPWDAAAHVETMICGCDPKVSVAYDLAEIRDAFDWKCVLSGDVEKLTAELVGVFARIGAASDEELARM